MKKQNKNYSGFKFNSITIIERDEDYFQPNGAKIIKWKCICICGKKWSIPTSNINRIKSCGCITKNKTHGERYSKEYNSWRGMKKRCYQKTHRSYSNYGGRGITVCDRWIESFENFLEDMGKKPTLKHSLDRIDYDGNYCKENCRWVTMEEQQCNRRNNIMVFDKTVDKNVSLSQYCRNNKLIYRTILSRLRNGLGIEEASII